VLIAVVPNAQPGGSAVCARLADDGTPIGSSYPVANLAAEIRAVETAAAGGDDIRWLWPSATEIYPALLAQGRTVARCHDLEMTEALLLGAEGQWGAPRALAAIWARLVGAPVPPDPPPRPPAPPGDMQGALFDVTPASPAAAGFDPMTALIQGYRQQLARVAATPAPGRFRLLMAAESAGALIAAEMNHAGLPWSAAAHDEILDDLLGPPSPVGGPPKRLAALAEEIGEALGDARLHPDSPAEVMRAFHRAGYPIRSTRAWELRDIDHPAVPLLRRYKELHRIWTAHGWSWRQMWVRDGRFRAEWVPSGVVSGRWATRGGGALQIPKVLRAAVRADPGWRLVVADAGQLEPRILAAVAGDSGMMRAAEAGDMYAALATEAFDGDRATAKVALLGAMYGQVGGQAAPALARLRQSYPRAFAYVEEAARTGEAGGLVRSWLGRTCPPPSASWSEFGWSRAPDDDTGTDTSTDPEPAGESQDSGSRHIGSRDIGSRARARGRFTRNFVIQATAAEWALALLATLRTELSGMPADIVFYQHDEVIVHTPAELAESVVAAVEKAALRASRLLFGETPVRFPLGVAVVDSYADAK
jgi:DNA polymerase-1